MPMRKIEVSIPEDAVCVVVSGTTLDVKGGTLTLNPFVMPAIGAVDFVEEKMPTELISKDEVVKAQTELISKYEAVKALEDYAHSQVTIEGARAAFECLRIVRNIPAYGKE